jgi:hypothetical protein
VFSLIFIRLRRSPHEVAELTSWDSRHPDIYWDQTAQIQFPSQKRMNNVCKILKRIVWVKPYVSRRFVLYY